MAKPKFVPPWMKQDEEKPTPKGKGKRVPPKDKGKPKGKC